MIAHDHDRALQAEEGSLLSYYSVRYSDRPMEWRTRLLGLGGTTMMLALIGAVGMLGRQVTQNVIVSSSAPVVVNLRNFEAPPEPVREVPEGPEQVQQENRKPEAHSKPIDPPKILFPNPRPSPPIPQTYAQSTAETVHPVSEAADESPNSTDTVPQTSAPNSITAPKGKQASNDVKADWEALLLTHLKKYRRYPARARAARQQGVVHIHLTVNRAGRVLSTEIARNSGYFALDQEALATIKRAEPLPPIPLNMPAEVKLTVPVEFYLR